jgi:hypothetical protein
VSTPESKLKPAVAAAGFNTPTPDWEFWCKTTVPQRRFQIYTPAVDRATDNDRLSRPDSAKGRLQRLVYQLLLDHQAAGEIPTSGRFVFDDGIGGGS